MKGKKAKGERDGLRPIEVFEFGIRPALVRLNGIRILSLKLIELMGCKI